MEFLIREVARQQGQVFFQDTEVSANAITIGSGADQLIKLQGSSVAKQHAVIKVVGGQLAVAGVNNRKISVNGRQVRNSIIMVGDEISVDAHRIDIVAPPRGFDAACEVSVDETVQNQDPAAAYVTELKDTFLGQRIPAYALSLLVVLLAFVWPLTTYMSRSGDNMMDEGVSRKDQSIVERLQSRSYAGGGDFLWSSGPLLPAHQLEIGDDCSACHKKAFQKVQDSACQDCHLGTRDHFDSNIYLHFSSEVSLCQSCHKEHNEPEMLVVNSDTLCVDCHEDTILVSDNNSPNIEAVSGFEKSAHPEFKLNFLLPKLRKRGTGISVNWFSQLVQRPTEQREISNLKFPHDVHMNADKVQTLDDGEPMVCSDCHTLKSDNEHFEIITMERHCSQCHELTFNDADPERQLPHGEPRFVIQSLEEHFVRVYADPDFKGTGKERLRRRPGVIDGQDDCDDTMFNCAMERAMNEAGIQFTQRGCITCHEVTDNGSDDLYSRWTVLPVKINNDWYARGHFDHLSHLTQTGAGENQVCSSCHEAIESSVSSDVLIPGIDNCFSCHGDRSVDEKVNVDCVSCHMFHPESEKMSDKILTLTN